MKLGLISCLVSSLPLWLVPLLHAASRLKTDRAKRRKAYRLIQRHLLTNKIGCGAHDKPTYVYPPELKDMIRSAFPQHICDYDDPCHENVVIVTLGDLIRIGSSSSGVDPAVELQL